MQKFVDRDKAINSINSLLSDQTCPWIILSGGSRIGKTEFAKYIVTTNKNAIIFKSQFYIEYACALIKAVQFDQNKELLKIISAFSSCSEEAQTLLKSLGIPYQSMLQKDLEDIFIRLLIKNDICSGLYMFARFIGENVSKKIKCIFLDDFHRCDYDTYVWILEFWKALPQPRATIVAICNFELPWESDQLFNLFHGMNSPVNIESFDSDEAYNDILREYVQFENNANLERLSKKLFALYNGSSKLLFETIRLLQGQILFTRDQDIIEQIFSLAQQIHLRRFEKFSKVHLLVLRLLAYSPVPISKDCIIEALELYEILATQIIYELYNDNFLEHSLDKYTTKTLYCIKDEFLREIVVHACSKKERVFYKTKIYRAMQKGTIFSSLEQKLSLALSLEDSDSSMLITQYINQSSNIVPLEKKMYFIDKFLSSCQNISDSLFSIDVVKSLYKFGYYNSAEKVLNKLMENKKSLTFENLLLLGDIQHVLLLPCASQTYKQASEIQGVTTSDKLKAINRRIMALNQEHKEADAKKLYNQAFAEYEDFPCVGLVELYRNSNNSFKYKKALKYTIKGYFLAEKLGEELEKYKCLHNICMLQMQYGYYGCQIENNFIEFVPTFENVLSFFSKKPEYRHEQAYPLLDLGTLKMFEYANSLNPNHLMDAKKFYSEAQLYARSFYAQHIAETGLLIVNSYQYANNSPSFVKQLRVDQYNRYKQKVDELADYRVHRKILLSLALSAIITGNTDEAKTYLSLSSPYILGPEVIRFNKLCQRAGCLDYQKEEVSLVGTDIYELYYSSDVFVPWLISLGH